MEGGARGCRGASNRQSRAINSVGHSMPHQLCWGGGGGGRKGG